MASDIHKLGIHDNLPNGKGKSVGIVVSDYHTSITDNLLEGAKKVFVKSGISTEDIIVQYVPGAFELPLGCAAIYSKYPLDAVLALGCVVKGETEHDKYINHAVANGMMDLCLEHMIPFVFGLLTTNTLQQAIDRSGGKHGNKGEECAVAALRMMNIYKSNR